MEDAERATIHERLVYQARLATIADGLMGLDSYVDFVFSDHPTATTAKLLLHEPSVHDMESVVVLLGDDVDSVEVVLSDLSRDDAAALVAVGHEIASRHIAGPISASYRIDASRLTVTVPRGQGQESLDALDSDLRETGVGEVRIIEEDQSKDSGCSGSPSTTGGWIEGGRLIRPCGVNSGRCTSGFAVREISNPARSGILTAAHCHGFGGSTQDWYEIMYANGTTPFATIRFVEEMSYNLGDIEFNRKWYASSTTYGRVYLYNQLWRDITSVQNSNPINAYVCAKGGMTAHTFGHRAGVMCGKITDNLTSIPTNGWNSTPFAGATVDYTDTTIDDSTLHPIGGDSGAAVFLAGTGKALGIHEGGPSTAKRYTKVGYGLNHLGLELMP